MLWNISTLSIEYSHISGISWWRRRFLVISLIFKNFSTHRFRPSVSGRRSPNTSERQPDTTIRASGRWPRREADNRALSRTEEDPIRPPRRWIRAGKSEIKRNWILRFICRHVGDTMSVVDWNSLAFPGGRPLRVANRSSRGCGAGGGGIFDSRTPSPAIITSFLRADAIKVRCSYRGVCLLTSAPGPGPALVRSLFEPGRSGSWEIGAEKCHALEKKVAFLDGFCDLL